MTKKKHRVVYFSHCKEGKGCFVVRFDPEHIEIVTHDNEIRFVSKTQIVKFEVVE